MLCGWCIGVFACVTLVLVEESSACVIMSQQRNIKTGVQSHTYSTYLHMHKQQQLPSLELCDGTQPDKVMGHHISLTVTVYTMAHPITWVWGCCMCLGVGVLHVFGCGGVACVWVWVGVACVWVWGCCMCLGVGVLHVFGCGGVACVWVWGCCMCLGVGMLHVFGCGGVAYVWVWGCCMCLGVGMLHVFGCGWVWCTCMFVHAD